MEVDLVRGRKMNIFFLFFFLLEKESHTLEILFLVSNKTRLEFGNKGAFWFGSNSICLCLFVTDFHFLFLFFFF